MKYEYKIVALNMGSQDWQEAVSAQLDALSADGWELVSMYLRMEGTYGVLRRPTQKEEGA